MTFRPKVLLIAEAANPEWVSVPLIGYQLARALARQADVHVVTQQRNREALLRAGWQEGADFTSIDSEALARPIWALGEALRFGEGRGWTVLQAATAAAYPYFERLVWKRFGAQIRGGAFDIVHRVTPLSPTIASPLARRCARAGRPFVLGPLNGGVPWPRAFDAARRQEAEWLSYLRGAYRALPGRAATLRHSAAVIAGSHHTASEMRTARDRLFWLPENGIDPARFDLQTPLPEARAPGPLRACFVGRMTPFKGPDMLLEAAAPLLAEGRMTLDMVGDGPLLEGLRARAEALGLGAGLRFHGWLDHAAVAGVLGRADCLSFPSIREFGGGVVLEAMALGVAPLVVDYAGPGELVDEAVGFKIPLGPRPQIEADLRAALARLCDDPEAARRRGRAGRARVAQHFTWEAKARQVMQVYRWVLEGGPRPTLIDFDAPPGSAPAAPQPEAAG